MLGNHAFGLGVWSRLILRGSVLVLLFAMFPLGGCGGWSYHKPAQASEAGAQQAEPKLATIRLKSIEENPIQQTSGSSCWAAAAAMIFRYNGNTEQTQQVIAERMGKVAAQSAEGKQLTEAERKQAIEAAGQVEVMLSLYPEYKVSPDRVATNTVAWINKGGDMFELSKKHMTGAFVNWLRGQTVSASELGNALVPKGGKPQPIIVGFSRAANSSELGHICVISGIDYVPAEPTAFGRLTEDTWMSNVGVAVSPGAIHRIYYTDPWDAQVKSKTAQEFLSEADFIITREIAIAAVGGIDKAIMPANESGVPEGMGWMPF